MSWMPADHKCHDADKRARSRPSSVELGRSILGQECAAQDAKTQLRHHVDKADSRTQPEWVRTRRVVRQRTVLPLC